MQVLLTTHEAPACARLVRRRLALTPPPEKADLRADITSRLPWARWATAGGAAAH
jgi:hypothetical protein